MAVPQRRQRCSITTGASAISRQQRRTAAPGEMMAGSTAGTGRQRGPVDGDEDDDDLPAVMMSMARMRDEGEDEDDDGGR
mmetsp:Transcript_20617/g.50602  ORF Transcript_20617/g.50602 Transcript_20617/m.50602 type:complete len:80 (+) Transcript_20617:2288-2527(+)